MSIKTTCNLNGLEVQNAILRIDRLWGSSREGWTALVGVYIERLLPEQEAVGVEGEEEYTPAQPASTELALITEFNHSAPYESDTRGYVVMYNSLMAEYGGVEA